MQKEKIDRLIQSRTERSNLDVTKSYYKIQLGKPAFFVGLFIRSYQMGSGDGTTMHWEFRRYGTIFTESDQAYGSVSGDELAFFVEIDVYSKSLTMATMFL